MTSYRPARPRYPVFEHAEQPVGRKSVSISGISHSGYPAASSSACSGLYASLHRSHRTRNSRWATTQSIAEATRNVSTPISTSREIADAASFVCSEERTR